MKSFSEPEIYHEILPQAVLLAVSLRLAAEKSPERLIRGRPHSKNKKVMKASNPIRLIDSLYKKVSKSKSSPISDIKVAQPLPVFILSTRLDGLLRARQKILHNIKQSLCLQLMPGKNINTEKMKDKLLGILKTTKRKGKDEEELRSEIKATISLLNEFELNKKGIHITEVVMNKLKKVQRNIGSVFITFKYRIQRDIFHKIFPSSKYQSWYKFYGNYKIGKNRVYVVDPPSPINISWKNLDRKGCEKFFRRFSSWIIFLGFFFIRKLRT